MAKPTIRVSEQTKDALDALAAERDVATTEIVEMVVAAGLAALSVGSATAQPSKESVLDSTTVELIQDWTTAHAALGLTVTEAGRRLVKVGISRLAALAKDRAKQEKKS